uniref:BTB domain-containing protein n=1 Tax=Anopheles atroparvus TaxID=41427 RepID=A0A182ITK6_ANOAO
MPRIVLQGEKQGSAILAAMSHFQQDGLLPDVTLNSGGHEIHLHQVVLAACSPYFRRILQNISLPLPVLMLDVPYEDLLVIVEAMYQGSAPVPAKQLSSVLRTAETLMIRGIRADTETPSTVRTPAAAIEDSIDQQPGPSGLGRSRVRFASPAAEIIVDMMHSTSLVENAPQADSERKQLWSDMDLAYALQIEIPDSTGDGEVAPETCKKEEAEPRKKDDDEDEPMDIDMPDCDDQTDPLENNEK